MPSFIVHAHFYQPPREDPLTEKIPVESSAFPYQNWNERIYSECYKPNADLGNFSKISFNIGPTLFSWLDKTHQNTTRRIVSEDKNNFQKFGAGNAIAQPFNHTILPLSTRRDKKTQIAWGIAEFTYRYGRYPKGIWLPETAVDYEVLNLLSDFQIKFTILAPWQAQTDIDPTKPYRVDLDGGRNISVFFYNNELSTTVSFNPWATVNADEFVQDRLFPYFNSSSGMNGKEKVILIASDGELYGHHQPMRNFFLERLLDGAVGQLPLTATFPELWLQENEVKESVRIVENTSWSCHHGLGRWLGECECTPGNKSWKMKLWSAFYSLGEQIDQLYEDFFKILVKDPWTLRNQYIRVILGEMDFESFLIEYAIMALDPQLITQCQRLLEAQRERQKMFTSCGWFFDRFNRIEPRNNLAYAAKAVHLVHQATGDDLSPGLLSVLDFAIGSDRETAADLFSCYLARYQSSQGY